MSVFVCFPILVYLLFPLQLCFFPKNDSVFVNNIETEMGEEFFHLFRFVFIPTATRRGWRPLLSCACRQCVAGVFVCDVQATTTVVASGSSLASCHCLREDSKLAHGCYTSCMHVNCRQTAQTGRTT